MFGGVAGLAINSLWNVHYVQSEVPGVQGRQGVSALLMAALNWRKVKSVIDAPSLPEFAETVARTAGLVCQIYEAREDGRRTGLQRHSGRPQ